MIEADEGIDLRNRLLKIGAELLHHAAADDQALDPFSLALGDLQDGVDRLFLRRVDEAAGVDDDDFSFADLGRELRAVVRELGDVTLTVDRVLVAAEGKKREFQRC